MFEVWTPPTMIWSMRYSLKKWAHDSLNCVSCTCWQWNLPDQGLTCLRNPAFFFHLRLPLSPQRNLKTWLLEFEVPESLSIFGKSSTHKLRTNHHQPPFWWRIQLPGTWCPIITCSNWVRQKARKMKEKKAISTYYIVLSNGNTEASQAMIQTGNKRPICHMLFYLLLVHQSMIR